MTVELNLPVTVQDVRSFSEANGEPTWFTELRTAALDKVTGLDLPKPDRTNITKWDFVNFPAHSVVSEEFTTLDALPEEAKGLIDLEAQGNLYIQRNNTPAYIKTSQELSDKGVIFTDMLTAVREHGELVQKYFMTEAVKVDEHKLTALHAALVNGGVFVYVPKKT